MATRIVCNDPNATGDSALEIAETGQVVAYGEEVEIEDPELAERLLEQDIWVRPTTKAAKVAKKESD